MLKGWRTKGISLPFYQDVVVFLEEGSQYYLIGPSGDHASASYVLTAVATAAISGATSLVVDSITGVSNGGHIGVVQDDNTIKWTTVSGAPSGSTITLAGGLTAAAAVDNPVYIYTSIAQRPLTVKEARLRTDGISDKPVTVLTRQEYFNLTNKTSQGTIHSVYYDPQLTNGVLYTWETSDTVSKTLHLTVQRQVQDIDAGNDDMDYPVEWLETIIYNLSVRMFNFYGIDQVTQQSVKALADEFRMDAEDFDREDSIQFEPAYE